MKNQLFTILIVFINIGSLWAQNTNTTVDISGQILTVNGINIPDAQVNITAPSIGTANYNSPFSVQEIPSNSSISINEIIPPADITPQKSVSTHDLILIEKHILTIKEFQETYQFIAADASNDGIVSTFDLVLLRQMILHITNKLSINTFWKSFISTPSELELEVPLAIANVTEDINDLNFTLVKTGDVDGDFRALESPLEQGEGQLDISATLNTPNTIDFTFENLDEYEGFQLALVYNTDEIEIIDMDFHHPDIFDSNNLSLDPEAGVIRMSWTSVWENEMLNTPLFSINFETTTTEEPTDIFTISSEYMAAEAYYEEKLFDINLDVNYNLTNVSFVEGLPNITFFPNPCTDVLNINWHQTKGDFIKVDLFDIKGQLIKNIYTGKVNAGMQFFTTKVMDLPQSTFVLRISNEETILHSQLMTKAIE